MREINYLLSVCITSYKRVKELERCLNSIDSKQTDKIEIIVSEDCSPMRDEIRKVVSLYSAQSPYHVVFNTNEHNLGYDGNLKKLVMLASGEYVMYLSDDDCLFPGKFDEFIQCLEAKHPAMAYGSFWYGYREMKSVRRKYISSHYIPSGIESAGGRVYDAILFSGLTFKRNLILGIDAERFKNLNYFQVYLFLTIINKYGGYYQDTLLIDSVSDGENAYGKVKSSGSNDLLANRDSVFSNLEFNKGLFKVIQMFDEDNGTEVFKHFGKEYSLRSFGGFCRARKYGMRIYQEYWRRLRHSGVRLSFICYLYYYCVAIFGVSLSQLLFSLPKKVLLLVRKHY